MCYWPIIPSFVIGGYIACQDFKKHEISIFLAILYVLSCVFYSQTFCPWPIAIFSIIGISSYFVCKKQAFGAGDYVVVFGSSFIVSSDLWPFFIALIGFFGILTAFISGKNIIPFVPSIILATCSIAIFELFC